VITGKRVLVTGGAGFIGTHLCRKLSGRNEVLALDKRARPPRFPENIEYLRGNLASTRTLTKLKGRFDAVYHFGSASSVLLFRKAVAATVSEAISGFVNVAEFAKRQRADLLVYPSSGTVYRFGPRGTAVGLQPPNMYAAVKLAHETIADLYKGEVAVRGLRIFMGYGPGEEAKGPIASPVCLFLRDVLAGRAPEIWGNGMQSRDFVYIDDAVDAILNSHKLAGRHAIIDVGTGRSTTFRDAVSMISRALDRDVLRGLLARPRITSSRPGRIRALFATCWVAL